MVVFPLLSWVFFTVPDFSSNNGINKRGKEGKEILRLKHNLHSWKLKRVEIQKNTTSFL